MVNYVRVTVLSCVVHIPSIPVSTCQAIQKNMISRQVQKLLLLRKEISVENVQVSVCVQNHHSTTNFARFVVQNVALENYFHHFASNSYPNDRHCRIECCNTISHHSSNNLL